MSSAKWIPRGALVIALAGQGKTKGMVAQLDIASTCNQSLAAIVPSSAVEPRFLLWWLSCHYETIRNLAGGELRDGLNLDIVGGIPCPVPAIAVQRAIANYLDRATARIDAIIEAKTRMVALLDERLRAEISNVTSTGRQMLVRRITQLRTTGPRGWGDLVGDQGEPFIRSANLRRDDIELNLEGLQFVNPPASQEASRSHVRRGDVLVGVTGANTGWVSLVRTEPGHGYVSQHVAILRPNSAVLPEWLAYTLFSSRTQDQLLSGQYGGTKQQLGLEDLAELVVAVPSVNDQRLLLSSLEKSKRLCSSAAQGLLRQIALLQEHRQSLVTAAVTGQADIRVAA